MSDVLAVENLRWHKMAVDFQTDRYQLKELERKYGGEVEAGKLWKLMLAHARLHGDDAAWQCVIGACYYYCMVVVESKLI